MMVEYYKWFRILHFTGVIFWMTGVYSWLKLAELIEKKEYTPADHETLKRVFGNVFILGIHAGIIMALSGGIGMLLTNINLLSQGWIYIKFLTLTMMILVSIFQTVGVYKGDITKPFGYAAYHSIIGMGIMIILAMVIFRPF
ncbi:MAG: CopD family protein [Spirochaetia bacterium]|nr:CopD family protein [Spirochaetia bacterium]